MDENSPPPPDLGRSLPPPVKKKKKKKRHYNYVMTPARRAMLDQRIAAAAERRKGKMEKMFIIDRKLEAKTEKLQRTEHLLSKAKSPSAIRGVIGALCDELNFNPIQEMLHHAVELRERVAGRLASAKEREEYIGLCKFLTPFLAPTLKAIDMQADLHHNVSVVVSDYRSAKPADLLPSPTSPVIEAAYDEFQELEDKTETTNRESLPQAPKVGSPFFEPKHLNSLA
jgi:hypothetical protein